MIELRGEHVVLRALERKHCHTLWEMTEIAELADTFWQEYGVLDEGQQKILALHSLGRLLDILAAYGGPTPFGWDAGMAAPLLDQLDV